MSMMLDSSPTDPVWWLGQMYSELTHRQREMEEWNDFYTGLHPMPFLTKSHDSKMHSEFYRLLEESRSNFMQLIVDTVAERMKVDGFRLSASTD